MKRALTFILALTLCLACLVGCSCNNQDDTPSGMKLASSTSHYKLYVPEGWQINHSNGPVTSAQVSDTDISNVYVTMYSASAEFKTHEDYIELLKKQFEDAGYKDVQFKENGVDSKLGERYSTTDEQGNKKMPYNAKDYVITAKIAGNYYKYHIALALHGGVFYYVQFTFPQDNYGTDYSKIEDVSFNAYTNHKATLEQILSAFKIS